MLQSVADKLQHVFRQPSRPDSAAMSGEYRKGLPYMLYSGGMHSEPPAGQTPTGNHSGGPVPFSSSGGMSLHGYGLVVHDERGLPQLTAFWETRPRGGVSTGPDVVLDMDKAETVEVHASVKADEVEGAREGDAVAADELSGYTLCSIPAPPAVSGISHVVSDAQMAYIYA